MSKPFTLKDIQKSKCATRNNHLTERVQKMHKLKKVKLHPQKEWINQELKKWCEERGYTLVKELVFAKPRRWRFDWAILELKIAVEYNGIIGKKSRHTTITGYSMDMEKINSAQKNGWVVFQYTVLNYKNLLEDLKR